jgi:lambda repressor-like predicted transcriptional regulator
MTTWFDPLTETPEGRLLKQVLDLENIIKAKKKGAEQFKPNRGDEKKPKLPTPKGRNAELAAMTPPHDKVTRGDVIAAAKKNDKVRKFDMSDNCIVCGANPHEECRKMGDHQAINCPSNPAAYDSRFDDMREENILEHIDEGHPGPFMVMRGEEKAGMCKNSLCKNVECMGCKEDKLVEKGEGHEQKIISCLKKKGGAASLEECAKECGVSSEECKKIIKRMDNVKMSPHGDVILTDDLKKGQLDITSQIIQKYSQEPNSSNGVPMLMDFAGGQPVQAAAGYYTNQSVPYTENGPSATSISETFSMPAYSQTGYGETGSTLHMHLTDGGNSGNPPNRSPVEESMTALKKGATVGQMGIIEEIGELLTQVYARL